MAKRKIMTLEIAQSLAEKTTCYRGPSNDSEKLFRTWLVLRLVHTSPTLYDRAVKNPDDSLLETEFLDTMSETLKRLALASAEIIYISGSPERLADR
jgi:hypothetical protein